MAEVLDDVLRNVGREARAPFKQPERWQALLRAMTRALGLALQRWQPSEPEPVELERLRAWAQERFVSQQLLLLLIPRQDSRWDVTRLREEMEASALGADQFGQADAEAWLRLLVAGFYHGVAAEPALHELIALPLLRELAESMGAQLVPPGEGEGVTAQLEYIRQLAHRLYQGENLQEELLGEIQKMLGASGTRSHVQQQAMYQMAEKALGQVRHAEPAEVRPDLLANIQGQLEELRRKLDTRREGPGEAELAEMEALYRKTVRDMFERLTFKGITQTGRAVSLPLEEVYVELKIVAEIPEVVDDFSAAERRLLHEAERQGRLDVEQDRELDSLRYHRWKQEARREQTHIQRRGLDATGAELDKPAMVILGDPGSGKTTLLHYLALRAIRSGKAETGNLTGTEGLAGRVREGRLPIFVPLAAYDEYLRRTDGTTPLDQFLAIYYERWRSLRGMAPLFQQALEEGRALVLFDGLDEVLELTARQFVAQQVSALLRRWVARGNRFVLTSRFIGYREAQLPGDLPHFMVLDFRPEEIKQFARRWCEAFEVWAVGGSRSEVALQRARQEEQALLADVNSKPSVAHLASNPLLLTMLALLRRQVGQLPDRRIELYERYVRTLLDHWAVNRSEGARQRAPERLEPNVAQQHLMDLALWLQQNRPSGTARQRDMERALAEKALRREEKDPERATAREWEEAERKATRCIQEVKDIAGLLGERGQDAYGFLHLTFQEYFVGRALARESPEKRWELLLRYLHDPRWHEPILLCAGQLGVVEGREEVVADLLWRILGARSEHEEVLHRDLFLAAAVIADDVTRSRRMLSELMDRLEALRQAPVPSVRQQALAGMAQLMRLGHEPAREKFLIWIDERKHALETLRALTKVPHDAVSAELRGKLSERLQNENFDVRMAAVKALGSMAGSDGSVRNALLSRLSDEDPRVRRAAVEALGAVAGSDGSVREALLSLLGDEHPYMRIAAARALGAVAVSDGSVRKALLSLLGDEDPRVRIAAVEALGAVAGNDGSVREALLPRLGDEDSDVRGAATGALSAVAVSDGSVREALLSLLSDEDSNVRGAATEALSAVAVSDGSVRQALLSRFGDENSRVRIAAARALGAVAGSDGSVREALLSRLGSKDSEVRSAAVEALGAGAVSDGSVRQALLSRLGNEHPYMRIAAARALSAVAGSDGSVRAALLSLLGDEDSEVRMAAVKALGAGAGSDGSVREALLSLLDDEDSDVRMAAVKALGAGADSDGSVREALLSLLGNEYPYMRIAAARALSAVAVSAGSVREALLSLLSDEDSEVRGAAAGALSAVAVSDRSVQEALLSRLGDEDSDVRRAAAGALSAVAGSDRSVRDALLSLLSDEDSDVRRATIRALSPVAGSDRSVRDALLSLLNDEDSDVRRAAAGGLSAVAGSDESVREALLSLLGDKHFGVRRATVEALSAVAGSDGSVREALLSRLGDEHSGVRIVAAKALSAVAGSDGAVQEALLSRLGDEHWQVRAAVVMALSESSSVAIDAMEFFIPWLGTVSDPLQKHLAEQVRRSVARNAATRALHDGRLVDRLLKMLQHPEWQTRRGAAIALMSMPEGSPPRVGPTLIGLLDDLRDEGKWSERLEVAATLLNVRDRKASESAVECAMSALDYGIQPWYDGSATGKVRSKAAVILGQLEPTHRNERVLQRLIRLLKEDDQEQVCDAAYHAALRLIAAPVEHPETAISVKMPKTTNEKTAFILHLSDLHFAKPEQAKLWYEQLAEDLNRELKCRQLDGAILSGDITNKSMQEGYDAALIFLKELCREFKMSPQQVVLVPGNHDLCRMASKDAYRLTWLKTGDKLLDEGTFIRQNEEVIAVRDEGAYKKRFERFARFYEQFKGEPYPLDYEKQGILYHFPEVDLLVLGLNSAWNLDHHYTTRASINPIALNRPSAILRENAEKYQNCRKVAVWHHPLGGAGDDRIKDHGFLERLSVAGFRLVLHGHIHKAENSLYRYDHTVGGRRIEVVGAGTFGAPVHEWASGIPLQYNLLRFQGDQLTVLTRRREELNGAWKPDARWGGGAGKDPKPFYTLNLS